MLIIRDTQMGVLRDADWQRVVARLAAMLRETCPAESAALSEEQLLHEVAQGVADGEGYGFDCEDDLLPYLECRLTFGAGFEDRPEHRWMGEVLRSTALFPSEKADQLADRELIAKLREA